MVENFHLFVSGGGVESGRVDVEFGHWAARPEETGVIGGNQASSAHHFCVLLTPSQSPSPCQCSPAVARPEQNLAGGSEGSEFLYVLGNLVLVFETMAFDQIYQLRIRQLVDNLAPQL